MQVWSTWSKNFYSFDYPSKNAKMYLHEDIVMNLGKPDYVLKSDLLEGVYEKK